MTVTAVEVLFKFSHVTQAVGGVVHMAGRHWCRLFKNAQSEQHPFLSKCQLHNLTYVREQGHVPKNTDGAECTVPVVPPPGCESAEMMPGYRKQRKSRPYRWW